jgi:uncharacterized membrane protein HdeD (DUF308 family)
MISVLANNWWTFVLRGVLAILFGIAVFAYPGATMLSLVFLFGFYTFAGGILAIVGAVRAARHGERWGLLVFEGIVSIIAAIAVVAMPGLTLFLLVMLIAAWAIVSGASLLVAAFKIDADHGRWWLALGGIVSLLYGILLVAAPLIGAVVLTWWIGAYAFAFGLALIVFGIRLRTLSKLRARPA